MIQPAPDMLGADDDPADIAVAREAIRLAFAVALERLPPRQRAALILCEVLRWKASEAADLLGTSVTSVTSALQRARATLAASAVSSTDPLPSMDASERQRLERYAAAFERCDMRVLTALIVEDAA